MNDEMEECMKNTSNTKTTKKETKAAGLGSVASYDTRPRNKARLIYQCRAADKADHLFNQQSNE